MEREEMLAQFMAVTGAPAQTANFHLDASNWDLQSAVSSFLDAPQGQPSSQSQPGQSQSQPSQSQPSQSQPNQSQPNQSQPSQSQPGQSQPGQSQTGQSQSQPSQSQTGQTSGSKSGRSVATLESLGSDEEEEKQTYFAGGERSGMLVQDPTKRTPNDLVDSILKKAHEYILS